MRIKIYIVCYKNQPLLVRCLNSLFKGGNDTSKYEVFILNNYAPEGIENSFVLPPEILTGRSVTVIHNAARPAFSTGHLARSWNQCIIDAFVNLKEPDCDILITAQGDAVFLPGALDTVKKLVREFDYISFGRGDEVQVFTPEGVRHIGMFDEIYCNIGHQEGDYFRRAILCHPERSSINDGTVGREHNPIWENIVNLEVLNGASRHDVESLKSMKHHLLSRAMFQKKWGDIFSFRWPKNPGHLVLPTPPSKKILQDMLYPEFERDIYDLEDRYNQVF